jgi:hypothetical protein
MTQAIRTIDHEEIREWVEARGGRPAVIEGTHDGELSGILRVDFGLEEEPLEDVTWEEFFRLFDNNDLAFVYQPDTDDGESYACKFIARTDLSDVGGSLEDFEGDSDVSDDF